MSEEYLREEYLPLQMRLAVESELSVHIARDSLLAARKHCTTLEQIFGVSSVVATECRPSQALALLPTSLMERRLQRHKHRLLLRECIFPSAEACCSSTRGVKRRSSVAANVRQDQLRHEKELARQESLVESSSALNALKYLSEGSTVAGDREAPE